MAKRLVAKTGEYQNQQQETKGEYTKIGVILNGDNGEYMLLDPTVNLAGVLVKQNIYAVQQGKQQRDSIMVSVFEDDNQQGNAQNFQQQPQMNQNQPNPRGSQVPQNGYPNNGNGRPTF